VWDEQACYYKVVWWLGGSALKTGQQTKWNLDESGFQDYFVPSKAVGKKGRPLFQVTRGEHGETVTVFDLTTESNLWFIPTALTICAKHGTVTSVQQLVTHVRRSGSPLRHCSRTLLLWLHNARGDRAFAVAGAQLWNSLPHDIVVSDTLSHFRRGLKTFLFRQSYPSILF